MTTITNTTCKFTFLLLFGTTLFHDLPFPLFALIMFDLNMFGKEIYFKSIVRVVENLTSNCEFLTKLVRNDCDKDFFVCVLL